MIEYYFSWLNPEDDIKHPTFENMIVEEGICTEEEWQAKFLEWKSDPRSVGSSSGMLQGPFD